jgi:hypothetical protein
MNQRCFDSSAIFHGRHIDRVIIILCVRWYVTYKLSYRDLVDELAQKIRKSQFNIASLTKGMKLQVPQMWEAVLAA